ncbi:transporter [Formosa sp. PL04]|uniref:SphA family protein n=1 Tax=Formosa sp. PL04 TaxID=3081755 RepID=UPI0029820BA4|nr:transporter [Formosa sp. PL04]MDW5288930.1 transporter [Formosa sp. PL04]
MKTLLNLFICMLVANTALAQTPPKISPFLSGGYTPGIIGVRDYANPGTDGLFVMDYNIYMKSNSFHDRNGDRVNALEYDGVTYPIDVDISGYVNSMMFVYASPKIDFLGNAQYMFIASPNYTTTSTGVALGELTNNQTVDGGASGFGDLTIAPIMLSWGLKNFDIAALYMFYAPTGRYEVGGSDNVGLGYWTQLLQAAVYYYPLPQKATALMIMPSYGWHSTVKDTNVRPGSRFILEYGISQYVTDRLEITIQGGNAWQVGEDTGSDVYWDPSVKDKMSVVGGGIGYQVIPNVFYGNLKYSTTYNNEEHFQTNAFELELIWTTNFLKSKKKTIAKTTN